MEEIKVRYMSRKEYLKNVKDSEVGYALFVRKNIKKEDYAKLNTGKIVKVTEIRANKVDKNAIYYGVIEWDMWFADSAVVNFSPNIIDLIEVGDIIHYETYGEEKIRQVTDVSSEAVWVNNWYIPKCEIKLFSILTKEQFNSIKYVIGE